MKAAITGIVLAIAFIAIAVVYGMKFSSARYERRMRAIAANPKNRETLIRWVDMNLNRPLSAIPTAGAMGGISPIRTTLAFDWKAITLDGSDCQIQLLEMDNTVEAAYFTEGKRCGILVSLISPPGRLSQRYIMSYNVASYDQVYVLSEEK